MPTVLIPGVNTLPSRFLVRIGQRVRDLKTGKETVGNWGTLIVGIRRETAIEKIRIVNAKFPRIDGWDLTLQEWVGDKCIGEIKWE